jgi:hypothetical protein
MITYYLIIIIERHKNEIIRNTKRLLRSPIIVKYRVVNISQLNIVATIAVKPEFYDAFQPVFKRLVTGSRA